MKTASNAASDLLATLTKMGFTPARWDTPNTRQLDIKNSDGHTNLRVVINYEGEPTPHSLELIKRDGKLSQITAWESRLSAHMPLKAITDLIKASL
jgi:hypothetical protein